MCYSLVSVMEQICEETRDSVTKYQRRLRQPHVYKHKYDIVHRLYNDVVDYKGLYAMISAYSTDLPSCSLLSGSIHTAAASSIHPS